MEPLKTKFELKTILGSFMLAATLTVMILFGAPGVVAGDDHEHQQSEKTQEEMSLAGQLAELRAKMALLEVALEQNHQGKAFSDTQNKGGAGQGSMGSMQSMGMNSMKGKGSMKGMGMQSGGMKNMDMNSMKDMGSMKDMKMGSMQGMGMGMMGRKGMKMMGKMKGMAMQQSALPGFPGASHIYHIGATDFFLDHPQHISLTTDQQTALNKIKEQAMLTKATFNRQIEQSEQELWVLTSAGRPDIKKIEAKIRDIEKLHGDQRLMFIRSVGEAAKVLTDEQRQTLIGMTPPTTDISNPHKH